MLGQWSRICATLAVVLLFSHTAVSEPVQTTYEYDELGRLVSVIRSDGSRIDYIYDAAGNRVLVTRELEDPAIPAPSFSISGGSGTSGDSITFTVAKAGEAENTHSVTYATSDGTAVAGVDYMATSGTLEFSPSQTQKTVMVTTLDSGFEGDDKTFSVILSSPTGGATVDGGSATGTIMAAALPPPSFAISNASADEGDTLTFTVTKSGETTNSFSVAYATSDGSATAGSDYTSASGTLGFSPSQSSKTISVSALADSVNEGNETFSVILSSPSGGATIADGTGTGTIMNVAPLCSAAGTSLSGLFTTLDSQSVFYEVGDDWDTTANIQFRSQTASASTATAELQVFWNGSWGTFRTRSATSAESCAPASISFDESSTDVNFAGERIWRIRARVSSGDAATVTSTSLSATATTPPNSPPVAVDDSRTGSFTISDTITVNVLANDSDADNDTLTITAASCSTGGCTVSISGSSLLVTGTTAGTKIVSYTVSDGQGGMDTARLTVDEFVEPLCPASGTGLSGSFTTLVGQSVFYNVGDDWSTTGSIQVRSQTAEPSTVVVRLQFFWNDNWWVRKSALITSSESCSPASFSFDESATNVKNAGERIWRIQARVYSGAPATVTSTSLNATSIPNSLPVANDDTKSGSFFVFDTVAVNVLANDSDGNGDPLTISSASCLSSGRIVSISGSSLEVTGTSEGNKIVTYTIADGRGGTDNATVTVAGFVQVPGCDDVICL